MKMEISFATPLRVQVQVQQQPPAQPKGKGVFTLKMGAHTIKGENMASTMTSGTLGTVSVQWVDAGGNPAPVDGPTAWATSDASIVSIQTQPGAPPGGPPTPGNPNICNLYAPGPIGTASIQATADADMGPDVKSITAVLDITVIGGQAVAGTLTFTQGPAGPPSGGGTTPPAGTRPAPPKK
jgi:hypothetical protein